ncbi:MAG TPA: 8-amino-7-oxononanoate synthase [Gammaproteobacteria bacterium]|nr:8-amino-7-oxononanoate synthase [Gammaproteobacteria bacterium]
MWDLAAETQARRAADLYRQPRAIAYRGGHAELDGRRLRVFCSNDYLGLAVDPRVVEAFQRAAADYGVGSSGAHLITGHRREHDALEEELADFLGRSRALLFSTGYMANTGLIDALVRDGDAVFHDWLNHASLYDGGRLSGAAVFRYAHADTAALAGLLMQGEYRRRLIVSDGLFSMDGDVAPLAELAELARRHGGWLMVDDAHGIGVVGPEGRGCVAAAGLSEAEVPVLMGTLGKALGSFGAFVAGSTELIEWCVQKARTYIYTTALPPAVCAATRQALRLVQAENWRRERLSLLVARFRAGAEQIGLSLMPSNSPIQPIVIGDAAAALALSRGLEQDGFLVTAIRPPTVPSGTARLRVTLNALHSEADVDALLAALERRQRQLPAVAPV